LVDFAAIPVLIALLRGIVAGQPAGRRVMAVGILAAVWVNLHATALLAVAISLACALLVLVWRRAPTSSLWCLAAASAALAGSFINPYGPGVIAQTAQVQADSAGLVIEWQHANPASPIQDVTLALGLVALVLLIRRRDTVLGAALAIVWAGSLTAIRFMPFVIVVAVPVLAAAISEPWPAVLRYARSRRVALTRCGVAGVLALAAIAGASLAHAGRPNSAIYPVSIVGSIPRGCRVFTTDLLGSFLILARPDAPVSLDTRNTLYGRRRLLAEERTVAGHGNLVRGLAGAGCVLVPPTAGLARLLDADRAWQRLASDPPAAVLFTRR
jgi:hypothetical protein